MMVFARHVLIGVLVVGTVGLALGQVAPTAVTPTAPAMGAPVSGAPGPGPTAVAGSAVATSPTTPAGGAERSEINIAEAAETLKQDPIDFIYLSQEFVFNLLVVAATLGIPGVQFDAYRLPPIRDLQAEQTGMGTVSSTSYRSSTEGEEGGGGSYGYRSRPVSRMEEMAGERQAGYLSRPVDERGRPAAVRRVRPTRSTALAPPATRDRATQMFGAITIKGNDDLARLLELVRNLPTWERVGRFPLATTEKQRIDKAIATVYATAFAMSFTQPQRYAGGYGSYYGFEGEEGGMPPPMAPGAETVGVPGTVGAPMTLATPGLYGYGMATGQMPTVDPQALAQWYYHYQQGIAWERYVAEEILRLKPGEPADQYKLDVALQPQDLYAPPAAPPGPNVPTRMIHFDNKETVISERLSLVKPSAVLPALAQIKRGMETLAGERAREDSRKGREFLARLDTRKELRWRYRDWLSDQTGEIRRMAEDYRERVKGDRFEIGGVEYLVSQKPLMYPPKGSRNIVTDRLTPYDLLEKDGSLKKAIIEKTDEE